MDSHKAAVTGKVMNQYQDLIKNTTSDLQEHLQEIEYKLHCLSNEDKAESQTVRDVNKSTAQFILMVQNESASTKDSVSEEARI